MKKKYRDKCRARTRHMDKLLGVTPEERKRIKELRRHGKGPDYVLAIKTLYHGTHPN